MRYSNICEKDQDVPVVEFMYLVFTRMPGVSYRVVVVVVVVVCGCGCVCV